MGRPSEYTNEMAESICDRLADGESLRSVCRDESMPSKSTVFRWLAQESPFRDAFRDQYALAREAQADSLADDIIDIADTPVLGVKTKTTAQGIETTEGDMIEHRRLQVDARKWVAAKLKPKKYGDRVDLTHANPDGSNFAPPVINLGFANGGPGEPDTSAQGS